MRNFKYRAPRFLASAKFDFLFDETSVPGVCTNVSLGGVSALLDQSVPKVGGAGSLVLRYPEQQFTLGALVTHVEGREVGFSFVQRTEEERAAAKTFIAFLEAHTPGSVGRHIN